MVCNESLKIQMTKTCSPTWRQWRNTWKLIFREIMGPGTSLRSCTESRPGPVTSCIKNEFNFPREKCYNCSCYFGWVFLDWVGVVIPSNKSNRLWKKVSHSHLCGKRNTLIQDWFQCLGSQPSLADFLDFRSTKSDSCFACFWSIW